VGGGFWEKAVARFNIARIIANFTEDFMSFGLRIFPSLHHRKEGWPSD
jgi:hypothetical protein